jgi:F420-non-reducing hydrogenase iron-sulfur subunit
MVAFTCRWCSYEAADSAGRARKVLPADLHIVRLLCSGRADPQLVLQAFEAGADGVIVAGCPPGECHYREGNIHALRRYVFLRKLLSQLGIEDFRFKLVWASASDADGFVAAAWEMAEKIGGVRPYHGRPESGPDGGER